MKDFTCFKVHNAELYRKIKTRGGVKFNFRKNDTGVILEILDGNNYYFPPEFPISKKVCCIDWDDRHSIIYVNYESVWPEFQAMCYGSTVKVIHQKQILDLPNVLPGTVIYIQDDQLLISRIEKSPFSVPCAALLPLKDILYGKDLGSLYVFPKDEPLIVEGFATTAAPGRVHRAECIPGTGASYGDVPSIYAWISPDQKRHGWVFTPYGHLELIGKNRPKNWLDDRRIYYDPIWYDNGDEVYTIMLGKKNVEFPSLPLNANGEITRFQIDRVIKGLQHKPPSK